MVRAARWEPRCRARSREGNDRAGSSTDGTSRASFEPVPLQHAIEAWLGDAEQLGRARAIPLCSSKCAHEELALHLFDRREWLCCPTRPGSEAEVVRPDHVAGGEDD